MKIERAHARTTDPDTSHMAAASITDLAANQRAVLKVLRMIGPSTHEELVVQYHRAAMQGKVPKQSESGIRSRASDLEKKYHLVENTGTKRPNRNGRVVIVWRTT